MYVPIQWRCALAFHVRLPVQVHVTNSATLRPAKFDKKFVLNLIKILKSTQDKKQP